MNATKIWTLPGGWNGRVAAGGNAASFPAVKTNPGKWILGYGAFLILAGVAGFLSNPEKAKTALMSGGLFGALSLLWGWLAVQGRRWAVWAALLTTSLLTLTFAWRATVGWQQVAAGNQEKLFAAVLITTMLAASLALLPRLWLGLRRDAVATAA